jgi:hypothetical protein
VKKFNYNTVSRRASIQGETAKHNIWIDVECMNHRQVLYTALSRAKKLSQIKFVTYNNDERRRETQDMIPVVAPLLRNAIIADKMNGRERERKRKGISIDNNIKCDCGQYVERGKGGDVYIHDYIEYYRWCEKCKN